MSGLREAAQQALEALMWHDETVRTRGDDEAIEALRAALEQPEQEPVAYLYHDAQSAHDANPLLHSTLLVMATERRPECRNETPLYTHPPRREWRGLEDYEIDIETAESRDSLMDFVYEHGTVSEGQQRFIRKIARAIEAALKERNA